jgi:hypothetical protein
MRDLGLRSDLEEYLVMFLVFNTFLDLGFASDFKLSLFLEDLAVEPPFLSDLIFFKRLQRSS